MQTTTVLDVYKRQILVPGGRKCYCGKSGCADAYCAASVLTKDNRQSLDAFMEKIESGNEKILQKWKMCIRDRKKGSTFVIQLPYVG